MSEIYKYKAHLSKELRQDECFPSGVFIPSIADAQSGFWINEVLQFTRGEDCDAWIPPSQILFVEKIQEELYFTSEGKDKSL